MVFKKKYKILLFAVLPIVLLSIIAYNQYQDKKMYEEYISWSVSADVHKLASSIIKNDGIYDDILKQGHITRSDAEELNIYSSTLLHIPQDYGGLSLIFDRRGNREFESYQTSEIGQKMGPFFSKMNEDVDIVDEENRDEIYEFNNEEKIVINRLKELNSLWVESVFKNVVGVKDHNGELEFDSQKFKNHYGDNSLADDFWIDLIADMEKNTSDFLIDHKLSTVEDVFNE